MKKQGKMQEQEGMKGKPRTRLMPPISCTFPPSCSILARSEGKSGLWSVVILKEDEEVGTESIQNENKVREDLLTRFPLRPRTALESPRFAT